MNDPAKVTVTVTTGALATWSWLLLVGTSVASALILLALDGLYGWYGMKSLDAVGSWRRRRCHKRTCGCHEQP